METLIPHISEWFLNKEPWLRVFAQHGSSVEGWFKGEALLCFEHLKACKKIENFEREYTPGEKGWGKKDEKKIDFFMRANGTNYFCELKAMCISQADGSSRNLDFYFRPSTQGGLLKDFRKLEELSAGKHSWILSIVYPNPNLQDWNTCLRKWGEGIGNWRCVTNPKDFPDWMFLGFWKCDDSIN